MTLPAPLRPLFSDGTIRTAQRLLQTARVEHATFFRDGFAGDVVASNGRVFPVVVALDGSRALKAATCACSPRLRPRDLCYHAAALLLQLHPEEDGRLRGERWERSLWHALARGHFEEGTAGTPAAPDATRGGPLVVTDAAGRKLLEISPVPRGLPEAARSKEAHLARLLLSPDEADFNTRGVRTRRQLWEASPWCRLAKSCFGTLPDDGFRLERRDGGLAFVYEGPGTSAVFLPARSTVAALLRERRELFERHGFTILQGALRPSLSLSLTDEGDLLLTPYFLEEGGADHRRKDLEGSRYGEHYLLPDAPVFATAAEARPFFAEPEAADQAALRFDETYAPSPVGVPFDRHTRVPAPELPRFLRRHREELLGLPRHLVPEALLGGGLSAAPGDATFTLEAEEGGRLLLSLDYRLPSGPLPFERVRAARRQKLPHLQHGNLLLNVDDPAFGWLDELPADAFVGQGKAARLSLTPLQYLRVRSYVHGKVALATAPDREAGTGGLERLEALLPERPAPDPSRLGVPLYGFQEAGYRWLWFLHRNDFGGLLCDDMGLGKTHQALALVDALRLEGHTPRVLVVCPASLLPHWQEKLARYLPTLPVSLHHGPGRGDPPEQGVTLTSYGTLRADADAFASRPFDLFLLDEIQTIKNRGTETHRALSRVRARLAIGLTGTPIENRVGELRSLLDFVLPGYLPGEAEFERAFVEPLEERNDPRALTRLRRLLHPFVLRRSKAQVLTDLPEKIVDTRFPSLTPGQAELYREVVQGKARALAERLTRDEAPPYLHVFAVLSRLKQICDHPALVAPEAAEAGSGKWNLLVELLDECLSSGLKVVVFSQYVRMLELLRRHLDEQAVGHAGITGATRDRAGELRRFAEDPGCRVFAASLRASGLGVDLTAASVVIHYDLWWNRAREDQATDRVHRHGQRRGVQVIRLVTRGTIEEKIDAIIARKAALSSDLVPEDDPRLAKQFTKEELAELLAG